MRTPVAIAFGLLVTALAGGCSKVSVSLDHLPCEDGRCAAGYTCNATTDLCDKTDAPCTLGTVHDCAGCGDDCLAGDQVLDAVCDSGGTTPSCTITACTSGWTDVNHNAADGCEAGCVPRGAETCNGVDDDCNGLVDTADPALDTQPEVDSWCGAGHCVDCGVAAWSCAATGCLIGRCASGAADHDGSAMNGCEANCIPETDAEFCARVRGCGTMTGIDSCGDDRSADCGGCAAPDLCGGCGTPGVCGSWWDTAWQHRLPLTLTAGATAVPAGYSVRVDLDHAGSVAAGETLANGDDIRVLWRDGTTWRELDRVVDPESSWNSATTVLWFSLRAPLAAAAVSRDYFIYYGNAAAGPPPAAEGNVFYFADFFDRADAESLDNGWEQRDSPSTGAAGDIDIGGGAFYFADSSNLSNEPAAYHTFPAVGGPGGASVVLWRFAFDWTRVAAETTYRIHMQLIDSTAAGGFPPASDVFADTDAGPSLLSSAPSQGMIDFEGFGTSDGGSVSQAAIVSGRHAIAVLVRAGGTQTYDVYVDGAAVATDVDFASARTTLDAVRFFTWQASTSAFTGRAFDYVLLRAWVDPEPTVALGSDQINACP